jgi:tRNA threonylcarbamoyl adenosine modification protein YeaZ
MSTRNEIWLSVDLSAPTGSYALHKVQGERFDLIAETLAGGGNHTETAVDQVAETLKKGGVLLEDVTRLLTPLGPGSFTGLRLAMSTLKAFAFALQTPITTVSGSEARWIARGAKDPGTVLTFSTSDKVVVARFDRDARPGFESVLTYGELSAETPNVLLLDDRVTFSKLPKSWQERAEIFPLRARHLAETARLATTRRDYTTSGEWIALAPEYLGTSFKPSAVGG